MRLSSALATTLFIGCLLAPLSGKAQEVERERQVPILPAEGVLEVSADLRNRLGLFPDIDAFRAARLFERENGDTVLEIESAREGIIERERRTLPDHELAELREEVGARFATADQVFDSEGRGGFVLGHTLLGLGYHGWAVPVALDIDSAQGAVGTYLLTAGAAFLVPYWLSRSRNVTEPHRDLSLYGATRGILYGVLLSDAVRGSGSDATRARLGGGLMASIGGSVLGFAAADRFRPDEGQESLWEVMGDFGLAGGALLAYVAGPYASRDVDEFTAVQQSETRNTSLGHAVTTIGGAGGLLTGGWMGARQPYSEGNATILRSAGILGAQTGITLTRAGTRDERSIAAGALAGGIAGIATGHRLLANEQFSTGEGLLVNAGHLAGGAAALGLTYLLVQSVDDHPLLYLTTSTAGSLVGAGLVYRALDSALDNGSGLSLGPLHEPGADGREGRSKGIRSGIRAATVMLHPQNALPSLLSGSGARGAPPTSAPLLTIRF